MNRNLLFFLLLLLVPFGRAQLTLAAADPRQKEMPGACAGDDGRTEELSDCQRRPRPPAIHRAEQPYASPEMRIAPRRPAPLARTQFEIFVEDATGERLKTYGRQLFEEVPTTFVPLDRVPVPADYELGPGDELLIRAWGKIDLDVRAIIDRNGQISLPRVGVLPVAGLRYSQAGAFLQTAIGRLFKDFTLDVTLGQLRSIQIFVLGNARRPGAYTIGSLSTLVNALFVAGGPSAAGSMRQVQLIRNHQVLTEFDIYALVQRGDTSRDQRLLPGDILFIPPLGPQVAVAGSVQQPGIYELSGKSTVGDLIASANGLTSLADTRRAVLERAEDHRQRRLEEFSLSAPGLQRAIKDGDILRIQPLSPRFENVVTLRGNVAQPGRYLWKEGMRVSDLIPSRGFLLTREYWNRENQVALPAGKHPFGDPRLRPNKVQAAGSAEGSENYDGSAAGPAAERDSSGLPPLASEEPLSARPEGGSQLARAGERSGGTAEFDDDARDPAPEPGQSDGLSKSAEPSGTVDIVRNHSEINWHYASIERLDEHDLSPRLIPFELGNAIDRPGSPDNQWLLPGDVVTVFSRLDIPLPVEEHATFIRVGGEVNAPGVYRVSPGNTLRDAVRQAGGLTPHSYLYASQLLRVSTRRIQQEQLKRSTEQMQRELSASYANRSLPSKNEDESQLSLRQALIARIASIAPTGRVVLEMKPDASTLDDIPDFTLEDGDSFYIPPRLSTIQVSGAVYNENAFRYQPSKMAIAYLDDAGGATRDADTRRMFLIRADGTVVSRQSRSRGHHASFEKTALLPGDAIVIPVKLNTGAGWRQLEQVTGILSQSAITAASLAVIQK